LVHVFIFRLSEAWLDGTEVQFKNKYGDVL